MARIRTYGLDSNIDPADKIIGTDGTPGPGQGDTKNFSVSTLVSYIDNEIGAVDGSGTPNTIPMWTPDGDTLGDSVIVQNIAGSRIDINAVTAINANAGITGNLDVSLTATFEGDVSLGEGLKDASDSYGTNNQILTSTGTQTSWQGFSTLVPNNITGSGTVNTVTMFTPDGAVIGNSNITQDVSGNITAGNNLTVTDDLLVGGDFDVNGSVTLGDSQADTTTINSTLVINSIVQDSDQTLGTDGQLLVSNATSELIWQDFATLVPNNITGSGTVEYIPKFTPDGTAIGNSIMFTKPNGTEIQVGVLGANEETILGAGFMATTGFSATTVTATNINAGATGTLTANGNIILGDNASDTTTINSILKINSVVQDSNQTLGTDGQILVANAASELLWQDQDGDTTYSVSSQQASSDVEIVLAGSDVTESEVTLVAGNSITLTDDGSNNITIAATGGAANTTYSLNNTQAATYTDLQLVGSDATTDSYRFEAGTGVTFDQDPGVATTIEFDITSSGAVGGSGTLNTVPLWTPDGDTLGNSSLTVNADGGVTIDTLAYGTSNLTPELTLRGNKANLILESLGYGDAFIFFRPNPTSGSLGVFDITDPVPATPSAKFVWTKSSSEYMRLDTVTGNLGVGTTNPSHKVTVEGQAGFKATDGGNTYFNVNKDNSSGVTFIGTGVNGASLYIGAPVPNYSQNLQVLGTGKFRDGIKDTSNSVGTLGQVLSSTGTAVEWIDNVDNISLVAGTDISISQVGDEYTINSTATTVNTTYTLDGEATAAGETYTLQLNGSDASQETIVLQAGTNISFSGEDANGITINSTDSTPTLTDYEEGTWTPDMKTYLTNILNPINGLDFDTQTGKYVKINDKVFCEFKIRYKLLPTYSWPANEYLVVTGLPFTPEGSIRNSNLSGNINRLSSFNSTNADELPRLLSNACTPFYDVITPTGMGLLPPQNTNSGTKPLLVTLFSDQDDYTGGNYVEFYGSFTYTTI